MDTLKTLGADAVVDRNDAVPKDSFDIVLDLVGGPRWPELLDGFGPPGALCDIRRNRRPDCRA
jgi:NADPH:quinone reductase-like Zn-dependent oxidoreductase